MDKLILGPGYSHGFCMRNILDILHNYEKNIICNQEVPYDIKENPYNYEVLVELASIKKDDIEIVFIAGHLIIAAKKNVENLKENEKYVSQSILYGEVKKSFFIDHNIDESLIESTYKDGLLKIILPKKIEETENDPIKIQIK